MTGHFIDISVPVSPATPEWPGDTPFTCGWTWAMAAGASVNVSTITASPHVGTHADAPLHVRDGVEASDALPLAAFYGDVVVIDARDTGPVIGIEALRGRLGAAVPERLLIRTGRTIAAGVFPDAWPALDSAAATWLARNGTRLVGVDAPSVDERASTTLAVHHELFDNGACVLENLDLRGVAPGSYLLVALPQRLAGLDAAPVRAVLLRRDS